MRRKYNAFVPEFTGKTSGLGLPGTFVQFNRFVDCWMIPPAPLQFNVTIPLANSGVLN